MSFLIFFSATCDWSIAIMILSSISTDFFHPVLIHGAGGMGRELAWQIRECMSEGKRLRPIAFVDDSPYKLGKTINGIPVLSSEEALTRYTGALSAIAIGSPFTRQHAVASAEHAGFKIISLIHPSVLMSETVRVGVGTVVCAGSILTADVSIGSHVQINIGCTVSHDTILGDFATLAPGVHIPGWVHLGNRVFVGTGATFVNGWQDCPLVIGDDAVIGAGSCVTHSIPAGETWVGVPARPICSDHKL